MTQYLALIPWATMAPETTAVKVLNDMLRIDDFRSHIFILALCDMAESVDSTIPSMVRTSPQFSRILEDVGRVWLPPVIANPLANAALSLGCGQEVLARIIEMCDYDMRQRILRHCPSIIMNTSSPSLVASLASLLPDLDRHLPTIINEIPNTESQLY